MISGIWSLGSESSALDTTYYPLYGISGNLSCESAGVPVAGKTVLFYKTEVLRDSGSRVTSISGNSGAYLINPYAAIPPLDLIPTTEGISKESYYVAVANDNPTNPSLGWGANEVAVQLSGSGLDVINLMLKKGQGPVVTSQLPIVEKIKFGNRLYQKAIAAVGEDFIVSTTPKISADIKSISALDTGGIKIVINEESKTDSHSFSYEQLSTSNVVKSTAVEGKGEAIKQLTMAYDVPDAYKLKEGPNTITFYASNDFGSTAESVTVKVLGGDLAIVGTPITYPSPYSPSKDGKVQIVYTLSADGDVDIMLVSGAMQVPKKIICLSKSEGGAAGVNKVSWNGRTDQGYTIGNGIYSGAIIDHAKGKILSKFKLTVVD